MTPILKPILLYNINNYVEIHNYKVLKMALKQGL